MFASLLLGFGGHDTQKPQQTSMAHLGSILVADFVSSTDEARRRAFSSECQPQMDLKSDFSVRIHPSTGSTQSKRKASNHSLSILTFSNLPFHRKKNEAQKDTATLAIIMCSNSLGLLVSPPRWDSGPGSAASTDDGVASHPSAAQRPALPGIVIIGR